MTKSTGSKKPKKAIALGSPGIKKKALKSTKEGSLIQTWGSSIVLFISAIIVLQARLRLLAIPMERDEAGFAYIGHWLFRDKSLYVDMVDNKLPGLYMLYGLFTNVFGYNAVGVHIGLLLANVVSAICFYFLLHHLFNRFVATIATSFFLILACTSNMVGFAAHATQLLLPFVLGGFLLFWKSITSGRKFYFFIAGLLLGFAFIIKQQSVVFGVLAAIIWWPIRWRWNPIADTRLPILEWILLGIGGILPVVLTVGYFGMTDRFDELYFWSFVQPTGMGANFQATRWELFRNIIPMITEHFLVLWIASFAGLILIGLSGFKKAAIWFGILFFILGLASVAIGAAFYNHYFILAIPGVALLAAVSLYWIVQKSGKHGYIVGIGLALLFLLIPLISQRDYFFKPNYASIHQKAYNQNMFPELEQIGNELSKRVSKDGKIGIIGSEPGVLVAAKREGCSKHLFMYPLLSDPETSPAMQQEYLKEVETCLPEYIVWNTSTGSWTPGYDKLQMFNELMSWVESRYSTIGIAEIRPDAPGLMVWDDALASYQPQSEFKVYVFKRK